MNDLDKLRHLIEHWAEHNSGHSDTYLEWSSKAEAAGREDVSKLLKELSAGTLQLNELLRRAEGLLKG